MITDAVAAERLSAVLPEVLGLEDIELRKVRRTLVGVFVGRRELGHIHPNGHLHLPLPAEIGDNLVRRGTLEHHRGHEDNGWYSADISDQKIGSEEVLWILRLSHFLYELSQRGAADPITQAEMEAFTFSESCITAMISASKRWEELVPVPT